MVNKYREEENKKKGKEEKVGFSRKNNYRIKECFNIHKII